MPHQFEALIPKNTSIKWKWCRGEPSVRPSIRIHPTCVTELQQQLGLRTLEQRRMDAKVIMIYKIMQGLVAIPLPPYFEQPLRMTRHNLPFALRQIHTAANYYKFSFFPSAVIYWNRLPAQVVLLPTLDQFSVAVRLQDHHTL